MILIRPKQIATDPDSNRLALVDFDLSRRNCSQKSKPVLWVRDILVRIRILRSVPLTNGSGRESARPMRSGRPKNIRIQIRNTGTFTSFVKDKKA